MKSKIIQKSILRVIHLALTGHR